MYPPVIGARAARCACEPSGRGEPGAGLTGAAVATPTGGQGGNARGGREGRTSVVSGDWCSQRSESLGCGVVYLLLGSSWPLGLGLGAETNSSSVLKSKDLFGERSNSGLKFVPFLAVGSELARL